MRPENPGLFPKGSIFLQDLPSVVPEWNDFDLASRWGELIRIKGLVNKELEKARQQKIIGKSIDANIELVASGDEYTILKQYEDQLSEIFIVSKVILSENTNNSNILINVFPSTDPKCERCLSHFPTLNEDGLCPKCVEALISKYSERAV